MHVASYISDPVYSGFLLDCDSDPCRMYDLVLFNGRYTVVSVDNVDRDVRLSDLYPFLVNEYTKPGYTLKFTVVCNNRTALRTRVYRLARDHRTLEEVCSRG